MEVLTQELLLHAERCMRHEDVSKKIMLAGLNRTLDEWLCDSFVELIEEMELWKWDDATGDFWSRLEKALQQSNISVTWAEHKNEEDNQAGSKKQELGLARWSRDRRGYGGRPGCAAWWTPRGPHCTVVSCIRTKPCWRSRQGQPKLVRRGFAGA